MRDIINHPPSKSTIAGWDGFQLTEFCSHSHRNVAIKNTVKKLETIPIILKKVFSFLLTYGFTLWPIQAAAFKGRHYGHALLILSA